MTKRESHSAAARENKGSRGLSARSLRRRRSGAGGVVDPAEGSAARRVPNVHAPTRVGDATRGKGSSSSSDRSAGATRACSPVRNASAPRSRRRVGQSYIIRMVGLIRFGGQVNYAELRSSSCFRRGPAGEESARTVRSRGQGLPTVALGDWECHLRLALEI